MIYLFYIKKRVPGSQMYKFTLCNKIIHFEQFLGITRHLFMGEQNGQSRK